MYFPLSVSPTLILPWQNKSLRALRISLSRAFDSSSMVMCVGSTLPSFALWISSSFDMM
jgi:hypothetical protein